MVPGDSSYKGQRSRRLKGWLSVIQAAQAKTPQPTPIHMHTLLKGQAKPNTHAQLALGWRSLIIYREQPDTSPSFSPLSPPSLPLPSSPSSFYILHSSLFHFPLSPTHPSSILITKLTHSSLPVPPYRTLRASFPSCPRDIGQFPQSKPGPG